jgi:hypothetical protein
MIDFGPSFAWFGQAAEQRDDAPLRAAIPSQLVDLWQEVREEIGPARFDPVLGEIRPGKRFRADSRTAWAQTNAEKPEDFVNLTLEIEASELSLNLVGGYSEQFKKVEPWLRKPKAWSFLKEHPEFILVIFVRHATVGSTGRAMWKGAKWIEEERRILGETSPTDISIRLTTIGARLDSKTEKPALHIRRAWTPAEMSAMEDASEIAREVEAWLDPIQQIRITPSQS